jgi:TonB-dependent receptor-like protein
MHPTTAAPTRPNGRRSCFRRVNVTLMGVLPALLLGAFDASAQRLRGNVMEANSKTPLAVVDLAVLSEDGTVLARAQSDTLGAFLLAWSGKERVRLRAERLGFLSSTSPTLTIAEDEVLTVRLSMSARAISVDSLVISARDRTHDIMGNFAAIDRRRKLGIGKIITREQIAQSGSSQISDVLRRVPGITLRAEPNNQHSVSAYSTINSASSLGSPSNASRRRVNQSAMGTGSFTGECPMMIFLDGRIHRYPISGVNVLPATDIETIEVFRGLSEVPAEFSGEHARCGVIALWTTRR